ncbi:uncharacterized protein [Drosophila takahashii]|uniref:uncharacterized protein n=1 Tax=Drosophila takahashii TaxID=29030 RepID=UPI001CF8638E|nr:uncharacterized protein LOC108055459 [Drosophila takahashii]
MAKLELKLVGVIIFLVTALEAQETPATESSEPKPTTQPTAETPIVAEGNSTGETTIAALGVTISPMNGTIYAHNTDNQTQYHSSEQDDPVPEENGGDPFVKPGKHRSGPRHVKAHDGFHSLRTEKYWAHWNDAFTTPRP